MSARKWSPARAGFLVTTLLIPGFSLLLCHPVQAAPITLYNTAVSAPNNPDGANSSVIVTTAPDPHYIVLSLPSGPTSGSPSAGVDNGGVGVYYRDGQSNYINDLGVSTDEPEGNYQYETTFNLTGYIPATASISGLIYCDDQIVSVLLNGISIAGPGPKDSFANAAAGVPFSATTGFVPGTNTLDFIVFNGLRSANQTSITGLDVTDLVGTATLLPEPASLALLALGTSASLLRRRK